MLTASSAFAELNPACPNCEGMEDPADLAKKAILDTLPLSLWVEHPTYGAGSVITISGHVAHPITDVPVTLMIRTPSGQTAWVNQLTLDANNDFEVQVSSERWSELGIYQVLAQYGNPARDNKVQFELTDTTVPVVMDGCGASAVEMEGYCIAYEITGGMITGATITDYSSLVLHMTSDEDGKLDVTFPPEVLQGAYLVLVNDEESDDVMIDGQSVHLYFPAGTESVEFFAAKVIPEFGAIAAVVLGVALVSVIAISARSRPGLVPRI